MLLITLAVWCAALCYRAGRVPTRHLAGLCVLLYLSSMCKLNFHLLELAIVLSILSLLFSETSGTDRRRVAWVMPVLVVVALVPGPLTEMALNHATPRQFFENVLLAPQGRLGNLGVFWDSRLYFGTVFGFYPDNPISGIYWKAALLYGAGAFWVVMNAPAPAAGLSGVIMNGLSPPNGSVKCPRAFVITSTRTTTRRATKSSISSTKRRPCRRGETARFSVTFSRHLIV